jgi:hypothetical protein
MAKPLVLNFAGTDFPLNLSKVDRSDLYGTIDVEALDEQGRKCLLATLADDGRTVVGSGGSSFMTLTPEGNWIDKKTLKPTDAAGNEIKPVPSSYSAPVPLTAKATVDEYLSHNIRSVYQVSSEVNLGPLMAELKKGVIFSFPYSFRGGLEPDAGFLLLSADGTPFIAIGSATKLEFVGFEQVAAITEEETDAGEEEEIDFSMM